MADLSVTFKNLYERVSKFLGTGLVPTGTAKTEAQEIVNRAYRRFLYPVIPIGSNPRLWTWSFLNKSALFNLTPGITNYAMPLDFGDMETDFTYRVEDSSLTTSLRGINEASMLRMLSFNSGQGEPLYYCIRAVPYDKQTTYHHEVIFYPIPNAAYTFAYTYTLNPPKLENDNDIPCGGIEMGECLMQMAIAVAELSEDEVEGPQAKKAMELLMAAVMADKERNAADSVGYNGDNTANDLIKIPAGFQTGDWRVRGFNIFTP